MRVVYAVGLAGGIVLLVGWTAVRGLKGAARGRDRLPQIIAACLGFGLAGLGAAYAGWPLPAHVAASVVASAVGILWVRRLGAGNRG